MELHDKPTTAQLPQTADIIIHILWLQLFNSPLDHSYIYRQSNIEKILHSVSQICYKEPFPTVVGIYSTNDKSSSLSMIPVAVCRSARCKVLQSRMQRRLCQSHYICRPLYQKAGCSKVATYVQSIMMQGVPPISKQCPHNYSKHYFRKEHKLFFIAAHLRPQTTQFSILDWIYLEFQKEF